MWWVLIFYRFHVKWNMFRIFTCIIFVFKSYYVWKLWKPKKKNKENKRNKANKNGLFLYLETHSCLMQIRLPPYQINEHIYLRMVWNLFSDDLSSQMWHELYTTFLELYRGAFIDIIWTVHYESNPLHWYILRFQFKISGSHHPIEYRDGSRIKRWYGMRLTWC